MYTTFLASAFRTIRFGLTEAHGKGMAIQLNTCSTRAPSRSRKDGTFSVDPAKIKGAVRELTARAHDHPGARATAPRRRAAADAP